MQREAGGRACGICFTSTHIPERAPTQPPEAFFRFFFFTSSKSPAYDLLSLSLGVEGPVIQSSCLETVPTRLCGGGEVLPHPAHTWRELPLPPRVPAGP